MSIKATPDNNLAILYPDLALEWHPTKNGALTPYDVTAKSHKKIWWLGKCNHEWESAISHRTAGRGCPYCAGKKVLIGFNDLATFYPDLVKEWHPTKNGTLTPFDVTVTSGKKVWWQCDVGHEWEAIVSNRTKQKSSCPFCKGKKAIKGKNDLKTVNPKLAAEWHPTKNGALTPSDMMRSSKRKIWWICSNGHEWQATLDSRDKGHGCPYCSGRFAESGVNDLQTLRPDVARYWHPYKNGDVGPDKVTVSSGQEYWWLGDCGHEWKTRVATMCEKSGLEICPVCISQSRTSFPEQAIYYYAKLLFPDSISRYVAHGKEIDVLIPSLNIGIEYDGLQYHTEDTRDKENKKDALFRELGINIFRLKEREEFITEVDGFFVWYRPWQQYKRLNGALELLFQSIGAFCNIDLPELDINIERDNAEILALYLKKKRNDGFAAKHPELLKEWHPTKNGNLDPWLIAEHSNQKFWWQCSNGHEWCVSLNSRVGKKTGCPVCGKIKQQETYRKNLVAKKGSLLESHPSLAEEWLLDENYPLTPSNVTAGSSQKVYWKCRECGNIWLAYISNRTRKGQGCPICRKNKKK